MQWLIYYQQLLAFDNEDGTVQTAQSDGNIYLTDMAELQEIRYINPLKTTRICFI
jgi:hypothetical protein